MRVRSRPFRGATRRSSLSRIRRLPACSPSPFIQMSCLVNALGPSGDRGTNGRVPGTKGLHPTVAAYE